ncbi:uncharacterized protein LOC129608550 [Condylostylus longicornis]|uniref:uncharacterized protein LOC129608550 n=1 Tax=Condylostylus longicornis TaxID=2530218 RepID=UPI00244D9AAA|nr:uncharacterized protein LOC129608550 [Condylostylus longicornis]
MKITLFKIFYCLLLLVKGTIESFAAILQQTAQYILDLESEKTQLLSQNSQLKRQHCQHEGCTNTPKSDNSTGNATGINSIGPETVTALKKRKLTDSVISMQAISDSSDEGLGSMSPEPVTLITASGVQIQTNKPVSATNAATAYISSTAKEVNELKVRLENERKRRRLTEERVRILEKKLHLFGQDRQVQHQHHYSIQREVIEHTDNIREEDYEQHIIHQPIYTEQEEIKIDPTKLQVVELNDIPNVGQTQVVICSQMEDMQDDEAAEIITADIQNIREEVIMTDENTEILEVPSRLQPILEAAIKAEPKVEVERINATLTKRNDDGKRMYLTSTSRQNLETIVEAIRHLEGDHLFADSSQIEQEQLKKSPQETPLALTTSVKQHQIQTQAQQQQQPQIHQVHTQALTTQQQRKLTSDLSPFLQLKAKTANVTIVGKTASSINNSSISQSSLSNPTSSTLSGNSSGTITLKQHPTTTQSQIAPSTIITTQLKQCRPGVIVAKQVS